jgi:large subunit ribosomal protein L23
MSVLAVIPVASEKSYLLSTDGVYTFKVPTSANKQQIAEAVESQYGVTVVGIKTLVQNGKKIAFSRGKRSRPGTTKRVDIKKAYVTLKDGDSIAVFDKPEEAEGDK